MVENLRCGSEGQIIVVHGFSSQSVFARKSTHFTAFHNLQSNRIQGEAVKEENIAESVADVQSEGIKVEDKKETTTPMFIQAMLPALSVFLHALLLQWTLAFAVIMTFFSDWFIFEFCADGACVGLPDNGYELTNQRAACANFGLWLVTIAGYSIAFGTYSKVGWILTTSSLAMASFAVKADWLGDANGVTRPVPSLPIYYNVNVPDLLVILGLIGCIVLMQQPSNEPPENVAHQVPNEVEDQEAAPTVEMPDVSSQEIDSSNATKEEQEEKEEVKKEESGPRSLIGQRVAVEKKKKGTCYGTVTEYKHLTREWSVRYDDDGEDEDLNRLELASAFKLHSKDLADYLKAMWRAGEI